MFNLITDKQRNIKGWRNSKSKLSGDGARMRGKRGKRGENGGESATQRI